MQQPAEPAVAGEVGQPRSAPGVGHDDQRLWPRIGGRQPPHHPGHVVVVGEAVTDEQHAQAGPGAARERDVAADHRIERVSDDAQRDQRREGADAEQQAGQEHGYQAQQACEHTARIGAASADP